LTEKPSREQIDVYAPTPNPEWREPTIVFLGPFTAAERASPNALLAVLEDE
jgi:hypothetical protein